MGYAGSCWLDMGKPIWSPAFDILRNRIDLVNVPFSERGSRLLVFRTEEGFLIRLAERWVKQEGTLSGYRKRPPIVHSLCFLDHEGEDLPGEIVTYPHCIEFQTGIGVFRIVFSDTETLLISLPPVRCGVRFKARFDQANADRRGGILRMVGDIRRNLAYTTNAYILRSELKPAADEEVAVCLSLDASEVGRAVLINITPRLGFNRWVPHPEIAVTAAAARWRDWLEAAPAVASEWQPQYYYAWWIMGMGLISTRFYITREVMTPSKIHYVGVWQWDNFFHALAYRHVSPRLAQDQLRILLDHQRSDGMIPDAIHDEGLVTHLDFPVASDVTKPPLIAWAAWKLYEIDGDSEFLNEIYEPLTRWNAWWFEHNDHNSNGLCEYSHPFSSGLDDSPLWDAGMPVEAPDLNSYLYLQQRALARIARAIGLHRESEQWQCRADVLAERMIEIMWDAEAGLFRPLHNGQPITVRTPFSLFPLITGQLPRAIADRLVKHLTDPRSFWSRYPVPTVALDDPFFDPLQMWRGPTWVNVNYLLIEGLFRSGYAEIARELRHRTLALIAAHSDIYEYYHPLSGERPPRAAPLFGWSAAVFIDLAIQSARDAKEQK